MITEELKPLVEQINNTNLSNAEILELIDLLKTKIKTENEYYELELHSSHWKGTGKCWIQEIEDGKRGEFVEPYNVDKPDRYRVDKTYRLQPGEYLINEAGSKSQDHRYKLRVKEDYTTEEIK